MTYGELQTALDGLDSAVGAAEAHGWLCGALTVRKDYGALEWLRDLTEDADAGEDRDASAPVLLALHEETLEALHAPDFPFAPLLPGDEATLADRVAALASWCGGFLYGIGTGTVGDSLEDQDDVAEFLRDLADIARAELEPGRDAEAGEGDFTELVEFVRVGTQLVWDEMAVLRAASGRAGAAIH